MIKIEIIELIDIFNGGNHHILYTLDEFNYKKLAYVENRQYKTIIGEKSELIQLNELNDEEYHAANEFLTNKYNITIENGGHYTPEYRELRILRHLVSLYCQEIEEGKFVKIDAVPNLNLLYAISANKTYTRKINDLYQKLTSCFLEEKALRENDVYLRIMASGSGAITTNTFKKYFPEDFDALIKSSVVVFREIKNGVTIIYPRFPELIAKHSIPIISKLLIEKKEQGRSIEELCRLLIDTVTPIPYCDIAATGVIMEIDKKEEIELLSELIQQLLKIPPRSEKIKAGTKTLMYSEGTGHVQINFEDDMDEGGFVADYLPYAILSQIAAFPIGLVKEGYSLYAFHLYLLHEIGSSKEFIRRADVRSLQNMKPLERFELGDHGYFISGHEGIIEPIVQSIQKCFVSLPDEIEKLYERGFEESNFNLIYRIYLAIRIMENCIDPRLAEMAKKFLNRFDEYFNTFMANFLSKEIEDSDEREILRAKLLSFRLRDQTKNSDLSEE
ncbi:MAG TPA: hypothetical protein VLB84_03450 [Bacteroidia bacterium]|nr:hypothetical protein [Bacteroidia bacterium]